MSDVPPHELASPPPDLAGLCCLQCGYNLTGLTETRCPECGTTFDPAELRRLFDPTPQGIAELGFWDLWWQTIAQPSAFARRFPAVHDVGQARGYGWLASLMSAAIFLIGAFVLTIASGASLFLVVICAAIAVGTLTAMALCEIGCAAVLAALVPPIGVRRRFHFWRGLTRYGRSFAVLTASWALLALLMILLSGNVGATAVPLVAPPLGLVIFLWWSYAIGQMVWVRAPKGPRRFLGLLSVPVVGLLAVGVGIGLSWLIVLWIMFRH